MELEHSPKASFLYTIKDAHFEAIKKSSARILVVRAEHLAHQGLSDFLESKAEYDGTAKYILVVGGDEPAAFKNWKRIPTDTAFLITGAVDVFVYNPEEPSRDPGLPRSALSVLLELKISSVKNFNRFGHTWAYALKAKKGHTALFLFPGPIFPLSMGSHRRAYSVLLALYCGGFDVTVVYTAGSQRVIRMARPYLSLLCAEMQSFSHKKDLAAQMRRGGTRIVYDAARRALGGGKPAPESFVERARIRNSSRLRAVAEKFAEKSFDVVIVNYAWMMKGAEPLLSKGRVTICDTHDVQFERASTLHDYSKLDKLFYGLEADKRRELQLLNKADVAFAISKREEELLLGHLPKEKVQLALSGFDYAFCDVREKIGAPMRFGFIGHAMDANAQALEHVLQKWWPLIRRYSPQSTFSIAGSICKFDVAKQAAFVDAKVKPLGFVPSIRDFYTKVDVVLSPVIVAGGMNFKNAEALAAGVSLITNRLGASTLDPITGTHVVEDDAKIVEAVRGIEENPDAEVELRRRLQKDILSMFSLTPNVQQVVELLNAEGRA